MQIEISTAAYEFAHGSKPRGFGGWAFEFEGREPVFAPSMSYADAKVWIKAHIRAIAPAGYTGTVFVSVCS